MFKKLFGRKDSPTNEGKKTSTSKVDGVRWVKKFVLELSNMEGAPTYNLSHQLTVGSEVGNIIIADPSVSPRHCTFILQEDVVSVLDHGSVVGTLINGKKIAPGRYIILEESDVIKVGDLEIKITAQNEAVREEEPEEALEEEATEEPAEEIEELEEDDELAEDIEEDFEEEEELPAKKDKVKKPLFFQKWFKKKPKKTAAKGLSYSASPYATNSIVRLIAVICDVLIAYTLYVIFLPFDEFRAFVNDVPVLLGDLFDINWAGLWAILNEEYGFIGELLKDLYSFLSGTFQIGPFFLLFIMVRLISTLLFGVSISEAILSVKSYGNAFWKRIGGVLRVILGIFTGPFLIFDVPAVVSRRTFKEFMTFTHTYLSSKFIAILGVILFLPSLVVIALFSPLLQGLELPEPIAVNERLDKRVKVERPADAIEVTKVKDQSQFLHMGLEYDPQAISMIPMFKFTGQRKKLNYKPSLVVYHKDLQRSVQLEVFKTFDFKELLGIGMKGNFFLYEKFPEIYNFVYSSEAAHRAFRKENTEVNNRKFADEMVTFIKVAFELNAANAVDYMQMYTPLLKGLMEFRSSFLSLIEYKEFDQVDFLKLGNAYFLRITYLRQKPFDLIIPLIKGEGRILKVEFDKKENLNALSNNFYKFSFNEANWYIEPADQAQEALTPLEVLDFFSGLDMKTDKINSEKAQSLYGYYFEKSTEVLTRDDQIEYELWKSSLESIFTIMEKMKDSIPTTVAQPAPEASAENLPDTSADPASPIVQEPAMETDPRLKLFQNFQDLKNAVENKNKDYFGIAEGVTI